MAGFIPKVDEPSDSQSPLIRFKGVLKEYKAVEFVPDGGKPRTSIQFDFTDVTVIEAREPYPFPIATLKIPYSERGDTRYAAWSKSFRDIVPVGSRSGGDPIAEGIVGKAQEWFFKPAQLRAPLKNEDGTDKIGNDGRQAWGVTTADAWQIVAVDGYSSLNGTGPSLVEQIVDFADGKKDQDIYQKVYTEQSWKAYPDFNKVVESVSDRTLLSTLVSAGKLVANADGTYSKVAN